ncbi:hypothetical protein CCZ01_02970 [Helicobacter monodelphidis]|uniref:hypothetical protein n=1 Tax=Helicobacter sp. 15-1451 TaxID=2004995 RepID=UPI000DCAFFAA|nr:hypothetical protein [Helicobacter sp. 15-1451]RAX58393.1 hypothetical protein CCZ01_02970 [Helicobacter sp. 15-1451]
MYDIKFYVLVWALVTVVGVPTVIIATLIIMLQHLKLARMEANKIERKLQNIDFLFTLINPDNTQEEKQMALDAFNKNFAKFEGLDPKGEDVQKRLRFITSFALLDFYEIDKVAKFSEALVVQNRNFKKEIEHAIGGAIKSREKNKKK